MDRTIPAFSTAGPSRQVALRAWRERSVISWGAVAAGAAAAAILSMLLLLLGASLGLSGASPWSLGGMSAETLELSAALWIVMTQLTASGVGSYLAGLLRGKRKNASIGAMVSHDAAHGFTASGVSTLLVAILVGAFGWMLGHGVSSGTAELAHATAQSAERAEGLAWQSNESLIESLFQGEAGRKKPGEKLRVDPDEVKQVFANSMRAGMLSKWDSEYLARMVARHAHIPLARAEQRVNEVQQRIAARDAAAKASLDKARTSSVLAFAGFSIFLLIGAFSISCLAAFGGKLRGQKAMA